MRGLASGPSPGTGRRRASRSTARCWTRAASTPSSCAHPTARTREIVCDALAAGLHVLVEKPLCLDLGDVDRIDAAARAAGLVVQVGYMKRHDLAYERMVEELAREPLELLHIATFTHDPGLARWFGPESPVAQVAPDVRDDVLLGALVHDVNLVHGVLDAMGGAGRAAIVDAHARSDGRAASATAALDGGARWTMGWLRIDGLGDFREELTVYGGDTIHRLAFPAPYLRHAPATYERSDGSRGANLRRRWRAWGERYARQLDHFHACVTGAEACRTPPSQARRDIALLLDLHARVRAAAEAVA